MLVVDGEELEETHQFPI